MQTHRWSRVFSAAMAALVFGCADRSTRQVDDPDAQLQTLVQRAQDLRGRVTSAAGMTPELRAEFDRLVADIKEWQGRTGRGDIRVFPDSTKAARRAAGGGAESGCEDCPGYTLEGDRICFLIEEGPCHPDSPDDPIAGRVCAYTCIWIGSGPEPAIKR